MIRAKKRWPWSKEAIEMEETLRELRLNTVCEEASCPNRGECFSKKKLTFLILGSVCTRWCRFCGVSKGRPEATDLDEPEKISKGIDRLGLKEVVITSVTRDDLPDGGALHFKKVVETIKLRNRYVKIEVLTPDFKGNHQLIETVLKASPDIFSHNVETVPRLYPQIRPQADYLRSLKVLKFSSYFPGIKIKSGLMVGMGERIDEVADVLKDLKECGVDLVTVGQYLRPSQNEIPVKEYINDELFSHFEKIGKGLGFSEIHSGTFVRSSYKFPSL